MTPASYELTFSGELLQRGFWLYVWEIATPQQEQLYYVGRTGDSSSSKAQSLFNRMCQHFSSNANNNMLRRWLERQHTDPRECRFRLVAHGPIFDEVATQDHHRESRDITAALERALADAMCAAGYTVINKVRSRKALDERRFASVRAAFAAHFERLDAS